MVIFAFLLLWQLPTNYIIAVVIFAFLLLWQLEAKALLHLGKADLHAQRPGTAARHLEASLRACEATQRQLGAGRDSERVELAELHHEGYAALQACVCAG